MSRPVRLANIPICDVCGDRRAVCDVKTIQGPWAYLCKVCRASHSVGGHLPLGIHDLETPLLLAEPPSPPKHPFEPAMTIAGVLRAKADDLLAPNPPSLEEIEEMLMDGDCYALDGCPCEVDGRCEHGYPSWPRKLGFV